jgi:hypothetical protein
MFDRKARKQVPVVIPLSFIAAVIAIGLVVLAVYSNRIRKINVVFSYLAQRFAGELRPAGFWQHPRVRFLQGEEPVEVLTEPAGMDPEILHTVFRTTWPDSDLFLEVHPARFYTGVVRLLGGQDILTGAREFDREFSVRGSDAERVRAILSSGVQSQMMQLRELTSSRDFHCLVAHGLVSVQKRGLLLEPARLARFTTLGLELVEQALLTNMAGIEIVSQRVLPARGHAICRVCGDRIGANIVFCRLCKTPHHHDCWVYNGACAIYGCGETRYLAGRRALRQLAATQSHPVSPQGGQAGGQATHHSGR